jgi:predicted PurR-regulated permease PerM
MQDQSGPTGFTRERLAMVALLVLAAVATVLSLLVAAPFIPGLTWALAFGVAGRPIHCWIAARIRTADWAAGLAVAAVALLLIVPTVFVIWYTGASARELMSISDQIESGQWREKLERSPRIAAIHRWVEGYVDVAREARGLREAARRRAARWTRSTAWGVVQVLIALFALFYFFRDRDAILRFLRSLMPLSERETDEVFDRVQTMTHATIYGTLVVAAVQGTLGGLMFAMLGIPGAFLWGVVMGLLAVVPVLGAFVIWVPAAALLVVQGSLGKALLLVVWGTVVVGLIDNLLYPMLVGKEMRVHTLPVFIAIVGGLAVFGAAGVVLGPILLAADVAILDILKRRTASGRPAEVPT